MNRIIESGWVCADPIIRTSENGVKSASYLLAVPRKRNREQADFFQCVSFRNGADYVESYIKKGMRINVTGWVKTGSYEKDGVRIPTFEICVNEHELIGTSKKDDRQNTASTDESTIPDAPPSPVDDDGFMRIPDDIDKDLPFR